MDYCISPSLRLLHTWCETRKARTTVDRSFPTTFVLLQNTSRKPPFFIFFYFSHFFLTISAQLKTLSQRCLNLRENLFHVTKGQDVVARQLLQQGRYQALPEEDFLLKQCRLGLQKASQLLPPQQLLLDPLDKWMYGQVGFLSESSQGI